MRLAGCLYLQSLGSGHPEQGVAARCSHSVTQVTGRNRRVHSEQSASWCSPFLSGCSEERSCSQGTDTQRWQQLTQKFSFKRRASEAPNKGVLFPQLFALLFLAGGRRAGKEVIAPFKFVIAYL